jgi:outer membrane protein TolC
MNEPPKEDSIQNSNSPARADIPWIFRFSLVMAATCGVLAIFMVTFKSSSTVKNDVNSQGEMARKNIKYPEQKQLTHTSNIPSNHTVKAPKQLSTTSQDKTQNTRENQEIIIPQSRSQNVTPKLEHLPSQNPQSPISDAQISTQVLTTTTNTNSTDPKSHEQLELVAIAPTPTPSATETTIAPISENSPQPTLNQAPIQDQQVVELTLSEVVFLGLENNREIKNQYLERIVQKQDLAVAESKFLPIFTPRLSASAIRLRNGGNANLTEEVNLSAKVSVKIPTGADISFAWNGIQTQDSLSQSLELSFNQPLLRGAGVTVNKAQIEIARLTEKSNILNLKSTLIDTITSAILAYRELIKAQEQVKISQGSLEIARRQLEINQGLIQAGRLAKIEIFASQKDIADREVIMLATEDQLKKARLALLQILDIDRNLNIVAVESPFVSANSLDFNNIIQLAMSNSPDYLQALLEREIAQYNLLLAADSRRWNLDAKASYNNASNSANGSSDLRAGLVLTREFGNRGIEQNFQRSRVGLLKAENNLSERNQKLEIEVTNAIRDINLNRKQVELAQRSRELAEKQLEIDQEKLKLGFPNSRTIDIINSQNALVQARNAELSARIDYFNALTNLDKIIGTTLDTWQVKIESN